MAGAGTSRQLQGLLSGAGAPHLAVAVDAPISALQAFALGLPTVYQQGFGNPNWVGWTNRMNFFIEDSVRFTPSFLLTLGLRYELELKTRFPRDYNNFAPRAGFAWSPEPGDSGSWRFRNLLFPNRGPHRVRQRPARRDAPNQSGVHPIDGSRRD